MPDSQRALWEMASGAVDGIRLSTVEQREKFIHKYGVVMFWTLIQERTQVHECRCGSVCLLVCLSVCLPACLSA
jgi:hypothetical protein